jgi:hypothetical protein
MAQKVAFFAPIEYERLLHAPTDNFHALRRRSAAEVLHILDHRARLVACEKRFQ